MQTAQTLQKLAQGAEATIYKDGKRIIKHRTPKSYRHKVIDDKLRGSRTRREAKLIEKLTSLNIPCPKLESFCDKEMKITMEFIDGEKLRDVFEKTEKSHLKYSEEIGKKVGLLHKNDIVHSDLTTSNMIMHPEKGLHLIDFGLSFTSTKIEDKAVDLHLLYQALESKHYRVYKESFASFIKGYKETFPDSTLVLERLEKVRERGRNKSKH